MSSCVAAQSDTERMIRPYSAVLSNVTILPIIVAVSAYVTSSHCPAATRVGTGRSGLALA